MAPRECVGVRSFCGSEGWNNLFFSAVSPQGAEFERIGEEAARWVFRREAGLSAGEQAEMERWLEADPRHGEAVTRHERAWTSLDRPRLSGQTDEFLACLRRRKLRRRGVRLASAALIMAVAFTTVLWMRPSRDQRASAGILVLAPETRILDDGSVVELKSGARIRVNYSATRRQVFLEQGEAHFQVAHQAGRPFFVTAGEVEFRAVGTAFCVQLESASLALIVTQGTVAVEKAEVIEDGSRPAGNPALQMEAPLALVSAGGKVVVPRADSTRSAALAATSVPAGEMSELLAWRIPRLEFTETPLEKAADLMNQYNGLKLVIEDRDLAKLRVNGLFRADRVEAFVRLLEANFGVAATRTEAAVVLRRDR